MPWKACTVMSAHEEFVALSQNPDCSMTVLCQRFGISRKAGYKWVARFKAGSTAALADRSRRPLTSPRRSPEALERPFDCAQGEVVELRQKHRAWGGRPFDSAQGEIKRRLEDLGEAGVCSAGTVTEIPRRHDLIEPAESRPFDSAQGGGRSRGSSTRPRTTCGRWTSRGTSRSTRAGGATR
jgi:transposase-like protein